MSEVLNFHIGIGGDSLMTARLCDGKTSTFPDPLLYLVQQLTLWH